MAPARRTRTASTKAPPSSSSSSTRTSTSSLRPPPPRRVVLRNYLPRTGPRTSRVPVASILGRLYSIHTVPQPVWPLRNPRPRRYNPDFEKHRLIHGPLISKWSHMCFSASVIVAFGSAMFGRIRDGAGKFADSYHQPANVCQPAPLRDADYVRGCIT